MQQVGGPRAQLALEDFRREGERDTHQKRRREQDTQGAERVDEAQGQSGRHGEALHRVDAVVNVHAEEKCDRDVDGEKRELDEGESAQGVPYAMDTGGHECCAESKAQHEHEHHHHGAQRLAATEEYLQRPLPYDLVDDSGDARREQCAEKRQAPRIERP